MTIFKQPPLSLYVHIPWCVQKCPYCDFNSHALKHDIPEQDYVTALIADLDADINRFKLEKRELHSIFIGGGTPSLFSDQAIKSLLDAVKHRFVCHADMEVTLEANPGTVEANKFTEFAQAGVTRLSIGVQSFESDKLIKLGRIHDNQQAINAAKLAKTCGIKSFNLDLMHGLPQQSIVGALDDLKQAIALEPDHISWYQLTIEPNTSFYSKPPTLPEDDVLWDIQEQGQQLLKEAGYHQYEISAYAKSDKQSAHNLNYWRFGDYLGIGCGAHGKMTDIDQGTIYRTVKVKHPKGYLDPTRAPLDQQFIVEQEELTFEFMMNQCRLRESWPISRFSERTGLTAEQLMPYLQKAKKKQLIDEQDGLWQVSPLGHRYLNDLLALFLS